MSATAHTIDARETGLVTPERLMFVSKTGVGAGYEVRDDGDVYRASEEAGERIGVLGYDVFPLPMPGEVVDLDEAHNALVVSVVESNDDQEAVLLSLIHDGATLPTQRLVTIAKWHAAGRVTQPANDASQRLAHALSRSQQHEQAWRAGLVESAHEWANANDLCGRFDEFMEEHDLPRRLHEYEVEVRVDVRVTVSAESEDEARDLTTKERVIAALTDDAYPEIDVIDVTRS